MSLAARSLSTTVGFAVAGVAALGAAVLGLAPESPAYLAAFGAVLAMALWLARASSIDHALLMLVFVVAPIDVSKAVISLTDKMYLADAPGFEIAIVDLPMFALVARWLWFRWRRSGTFWPSLTGIDKAALVFLAWTWLRAIGSESGLPAYGSALNYSKYIVYFLAMSHLVRTTDDWRAIIRGALIGLGLTLLLVAAQFATKSTITLPGIKVSPELRMVVSVGGSEEFRPIGFFQHPNTLGNYLVLMLPPAVAVLLMGGVRLKPSVRLLSLLVVASGSIALVMTLSRGGWASFIFGALVVVFGLWRARRIAGRPLFLGAMVGVVALAVIVVSVPSIWLRLTGPDSRSNEGRRLLTQQAYMMIGDHPLIGVGFGAYNRVSHEYTPPGFAYVGEDFQEAVRGLVVHNHYLLLAGELGVPALIWFCGIWLCLLRQMWPWRQWKDTGQLALALGLTGSLMGALLYFSSDNYYVDIRMAQFWLVAGLAQSLVITRRKRVQAEVAAARRAALEEQDDPSQVAVPVRWGSA